MSVVWLCRAGRTRSVWRCMLQLLAVDPAEILRHTPRELLSSLG